MRDLSTHLTFVMALFYFQPTRDTTVTLRTDFVRGLRPQQEIDLTGPETKARQFRQEPGQAGITHSAIVSANMKRFHCDVVQPRNNTQTE